MYQVVHLVQLIQLQIVQMARRRAKKVKSQKVKTVSATVRMMIPSLIVRIRILTRPSLNSIKHQQTPPPNNQQQEKKNNTCLMFMQKYINFTNVSKYYSFILSYPKKETKWDNSFTYPLKKKHHHPVLVSNFHTTFKKEWP